ncbi:hypothetical protein BDV98DRAFT_607057 [Pterulicium gracile]|uniref:Uncharacterized protein n=1 Tax=Pterulicium gracile TaxID=1884261 RepID=A0A5C3Q923_9AGAR|nr:hypothetical protein BDV98DRAFT_607057 [Pterula gracilis]
MATRNPTHVAHPRPQIVALPSLSSSLSSLPQARSLSHVALHPNTFSHNVVHSEAKLKAALAKNASRSYPPSVPMYMMSPPRSPSPDSSPIMMRSKSKK